jgi:hypothetical protein
MRSWRGWSWDDGNFGGSGLEPLDDRERELLVEAEANGMDMGSVWMMEPSLHVDAGKLEKALAEVEHFATWG